MKATVDLFDSQQQYDLLHLGWVDIHLNVVESASSPKRAESVIG